MGVLLFESWAFMLKLSYLNGNVAYVLHMYLSPSICELLVWGNSPDHWALCVLGGIRGNSSMPSVIILTALPLTSGGTLPLSN